MCWIAAGLVGRIHSDIVSMYDIVCMYTILEAQLVKTKVKQENSIFRGQG